MGMFFEGGLQLQKDEYLIEVIILFNRTEFINSFHEHWHAFALSLTNSTNACSVR